jgi:hypothetical protein
MNDGKKWQANFQYFLDQFASHFSSIRFKLNYIEYESNVFQFNSSCMQCHSIFSFKWNLMSNFFFSSSLVVHSNTKAKLVLYIKPKCNINHDVIIIYAHEYFAIHQLVYLEVLSIVRSNCSLTTRTSNLRVKMFCIYNGL